ncbi:efflux RND transporter permease subunit [Bifidobacterium margollesii]|uniref:efflux RND transporter permease subunit n=1 Tax=Bifidobacterium margollesii TaxID=2020964 RepID=UPI0013FDB2C4|nr:MMPL family transporter [Bifidobacterium margollesii]
MVSLFMLAAIVGAVLYPQVKVNYSMTDYLPKDSPSVVSLDDMKRSFDGGVPNARLYAEGLSEAQADRLADDLAKVDGVDEVMWLGTAVDMKQPAAVQDDDTVKTWKTDGSSGTTESGTASGDGYLYQLVIASDKGRQAIADARAAAEHVGADRVSMSGDAVSTADAQESTATQVVYIMLAAVAVVILILLLTSNSWFEPVIFLIVIGVAIVMNMGSNIVLHDISFISQICGAILQLAVSMDYAIVLLHTFRRAQQEFADPEEAMAHAMVRGFSVVLSSAAVTFFGFLSLTVMRFGIGVNMGIVLAKGIVFSFLAVMFLMPALTLMMLKPLNALRHRYLLPSFGRFAAVCQRIMLPASLIIILCAVPAYLAQDRTDFIYGASGMTEPGSVQAVESERIDQAFGKSETWVAMVPEGRWADEQATIDAIEKLDHVTGVTSYITVAGRAMPVDAVPESTVEQVVSNGWSRIVVTLDVTPESEQAYDMVSLMRETLAEHYGDDYRLVGSTVSIYDLRDTVRQDSMKVKIFSMGAIALVLAVMFRSLSIPIVVLAAIEVAIWMNLSVPYLTGSTLNYIGYLVIDAVQLGAAVDYAIIYAREYFERRRTEPARDAARSAVHHSAITILTSATILIFAGVSVNLIATNGVISELGTLIARGAFLSMLMMFVFLPWLLRVTDPLIRHTSLGLHFAADSGDRAADSGRRIADSGGHIRPAHSAVIRSSIHQSQGGHHASSQR